MGKYDKLLKQIISGNSDANIDFDELCNLLSRLNFTSRIRGSHHLFSKDGIEEMINLQRDGSKAKRYQVRQVRVYLIKYQIGGSE